MRTCDPDILKHGAILSNSFVKGASAPAELIPVDALEMFDTELAELPPNCRRH